ncbi:hypothetical protein MKW98_012981 [Papaver atlanticum]|uniref:DCD domain-containing protein n=1 Tax=Papaver atlanticum TaxID=357466 RepID=A0AAD4XH26_9MAGN|nr:hypothetical protein MKW98_012981 [Papaver atlanticum]
MIKNTNNSNYNGSSLWQSGTDLFKRVDLGSNDEQTWKIAASRLALDNQLMRRKKMPEMLLLNQQNVDEVKDPFLSTPSPLCKSISFYGHQQLQQCMNNQILGQADKWYKTLPPAEMLPRNEVLGGYIFVCNNETMQEDLRRQLFGLPQKYKDSVRAITPGLPLFLYNYTAHQLHGVFQAVSFGGSNIDPTAWEDKKCRGESRFPAQVRIRVKKMCKPLEEDSFRPILFHYDGPKFRLQLSVPEALALLDLFKEDQM